MEDSPFPPSYRDFLNEIAKQLLRIPLPAYSNVMDMNITDIFKFVVKSGIPIILVFLLMLNVRFSCL